MMETEQEKEDKRREKAQENMRKDIMDSEIKTEMIKRAKQTSAV